MADRDKKINDFLPNDGSLFRNVPSPPPAPPTSQRSWKCDIRPGRWGWYLRITYGAARITPSIFVCGSYARAERKAKKRMQRWQREEDRKLALSRTIVLGGGDG